MKKLNTNKVAEVTANELIEKYKEKLTQSDSENMIMAIQLQKQQALIKEVFNKAPEAFPGDYILKEENNVKNK
ncbi:hypothetical protein [Companilactobacillus formosensis]|uniref:hypothetical protein n=1 Tax=Companilactobacillus formosensis TaxID=1617889 RepID=UPI000E64BB00|nr:hypothetical protein [Companilactobacillus formosensis]